MHQAPQVFGFMPESVANFDLAAHMFSDGTFLDDAADAKRRRISRVGSSPREETAGLADGAVCFTDGFFCGRRSGLRHVSEEKDQVRRPDASVRPLPQLPNRVHNHAYREEENATKGVR